MHDPAFRGLRAASCVLLAMLLPLAGCRAPDTSALEAENRMLEDELYALEDHCQQLHDELESVRRSHAALVKESGGRAGGAPPEAIAPPPVEGIPELPLEGGGEPLPRDEAPPDPYERLRDAEPEAPPFAPPGGGELPPLMPPTPEDPGSASFDALNAEPLAVAEPSGPESSDDPDAVASITLNRRLTGGHDTQPASGDEAIMVVVEPRTRDGRIVPVAGEVSIGVIDPETPGPSGQLARWDFSPEEAERFFRRTPLGNGLHFDLPWPSSPPQVSPVEVWVRLTLADGRKLLAQRPVRFNPPVAEAASVQASYEDEAPRAAKTPKPTWSPDRERR